MLLDTFVAFRMPNLDGFVIWGSYEEISILKPIAKVDCSIMIVAGVIHDSNFISSDSIIEDDLVIYLFKIKNF